MPCHIKDTFPLTHDHAVKILAEAKWTPHELQAMTEGGLVVLHHSFGDHIRKSWHLWEPSSPLARHYQKVHGLGHADDISSLIILDLLSRLRNEKFNREEHIKRMRQFWLDQRIDPVSQREIH